jgi:hypothetical protein
MASNLGSISAVANQEQPSCEVEIPATTLVGPSRNAVRMATTMTPKLAGPWYFSIPVKLNDVTFWIIDVSLSSSPWHIFIYLPSALVLAKIFNLEVVFYELIPKIISTNVRTASPSVTRISIHICG